MSNGMTLPPDLHVKQMKKLLTLNLVHIPMCDEPLKASSTY